MVAQVSTETFARASHIPPSDPSDSDDVLLALQTARALEAQGEIREAARWLRRAVEQSEIDDNDERVLALARAAADLTNTLPPAPLPTAVSSSLPPSNVPPRSSIRPPLPKPLAGAHTTPAPTVPPHRTSNSQPVPARVSSPPPIPSRAASPPRTSSVPNRGPSPARPAPPPRVVTMRVAIPASARDASVFVVRRLGAGQKPPAGTTEATLMLSGETPSDE
jgi:hypothetical protein